MTLRLTRRAALLGTLAAPIVLRHGLAQSAPIKFGTLTPLTGAGGSYGPVMVKAIKQVADEINAAGGVLGRQIVLVSEDDETNPDAGVRAARKLIDVDKVIAVLGTWASAVTTAVAPLCWENKTMLFTVSGGDGITRLPHQGYIIRTQPDSKLQATRSAGFMLKQGAKKVVVLAAQTPFAATTYETQAAVLKAGGADPMADIIYDAAKTSFRSEVDQALKLKPDTLFLNSYMPDLQVLLRDLYRSGYEGKKYTLAYAANDKLVASLPPEVTEGLVHYAPSPDLGSPGFAAVKVAIAGEPDPYSCQTHDHISLAVLAMARAKAATSQAIHDNVRAIGNKDGVKVTSAVEGMKLLAEGKEINYEGASGPCKFTEIGDIFDCKFRFDVIEKGKSRLLELS